MIKMVKWTEFIPEKSKKTDELKRFVFTEKEMSIKGHYKCFKENSRFPGNYFIILENDDGRFIINCPTNLKSQMLELTSESLLCEGDLILIRYYADKYMGKGKKPMKVFKIFTAEKEE